MAKAKSNVGEVYARRFVKGGSIIFTSLIASAIVGFLFRVYLARTLGPTEYGLFYSVLALVLIVGTFRDLGIGSTLVRYIPEFIVKKQHDKLKSSITFYGLVQLIYASSVGLILILLSDQIAITFFGTPAASLLIKFLAGWFLFEAIFYTFKTLFQGFCEMAPFSLLGILEISLPFAFSLVLVGAFSSSAANVGLAYMVGLGLTALVAAALFLRKHSDIREAKISISKPLLKELFKFSVPLLIGGIMCMILGQVNTILLTILRSLPEVGLYQVAYPVANMLAYFSMAIGIVLIPISSELWTKMEHGLLGQAMSSLVKFSFIFIAPVALIMISFPNVIISLLFGPEYVAAGPALQILVINSVIGTILTIPEKVIFGIGKAGAYTTLFTARAAIILPFNLILIPLYGIEGAAVATLLSTLGGLFLALYLARRHIHFKFPLLPVFKVLSGSLLTLLLVAALKALIDLPLLIELFVVMVPSLLFYAGWILFTRTLDFGDLMLLKNTAPIPGWLLRVARRFVWQGRK